VTVLRTVTSRPVKDIIAGLAPGAIAITPDGKIACVVSIASGMVISIWSAANAAPLRLSP